ncbi:hypothetical protein [Defluviimonas salinarum]|uniref:Uracil DNA glycosylase superfamily protein n=1 Tax=Defluviimonas salinarum TaxID=2992147 RepID=A0ABT3J1K8_9RHOB|nr:hypothetical protein [Defluviimonas salinarum]MCW3781564.1 hypothetical protein [Defluviimonas salinarum]
MANTPLLECFVPALIDSSASQPLDDPKLREQLTLSRENCLTTIYAPFEHIAGTARLVIVGITPGAAQANAALSAARACLRAGLGTADALRIAKQQASFSGGSTRSNLIGMLDIIGLPALFGIESSGSLFRADATAVHFTSALRNPVFWRGKNYNGTPDMICTPHLRGMMEQGLGEEIEALPNALWLPLGPKPTAALDHMVRIGRLERSRVLSGLPHPSGANNGPIGLFTGRNAPKNAQQREQAQRLRAAREALVNQVQMLRAGEDA